MDMSKYDNLDLLKPDPSEELMVYFDSGVLVMKVNRPKKKNSLTFLMLDQLMEICERALKNDKIKVIYFTSVGDVFSSGNDFNNFQLKKFDEMIEKFEQFIKYLINYPKVLIGAVNGMSIGVSFTMLALFDIVLASDTAFFQVPFIQTHQTPEGCSSYLFPLLLGKGTSGHLLLNGGPLMAKEAKELGFVSKLFEEETFASDALEYAKNTAKFANKSLMNIKKMINLNLREKLLEVNSSECKALRASWDNPDFKTIIKKFVKNPKF